MKYVIITLSFLLLLSCQSPKELNQLSSKMQNHIQQCNSCHDQGQTHGAPSLVGLELKYMNSQMQKFKNGMRGHKDASPEAIAMREAIINMEDNDLKQINSWFASQSRPVKAKASSSHTEGEALYKTHCYGCHQGTMGKFFTGSPSILKLEEWYIIKQCEDFQSGKRGANPEDKKGYKMAQRIKNLSAYQIQEIAAFLAN
ncbi:c-type cytochrome [Lentisphaera marina]|uniref:c-type cytochrome n=1 Tax=Lentisphaera marina TaxID=1111041 RepID=UPI0023669907|nr:c-type cytochrome [Lentisphaera marina]MDD7987043.1 c-type cytochrome [Lentisphaera marina]